MKYSFPYITHIDTVLPHIIGRDEFVVADKGDYKVVNYVVTTADTFTDVDDDDGSSIRRECRGLVFDRDGKVMSRRFHKFFNVNERDETRFEKIDFSQPHRFLAKLDGSMVSPIFIDGGVRWGTKMGITDTSMNAEVFVAKNRKYEEFAFYVRELNCTPIFEWCSRKNKIVIDYPEDALVLLAIRNNYSGHYILYEEMCEMARDYDIPVVESLRVTTDNVESAVNEVAKWEDAEGVVVRFDDGHMVKIKSEWYVLRHKSKDAITREKNVFDYVVNDRVDDVLPYLIEEDQKRLNEFHDKFWERIEFLANEYENYFTNVAAKMSRKDWAIENVKLRRDTKVIFDMYNGIKARDSIIEFISKNIGTQKKIDSIRWLLGDLKWEYTYE